MVLIGLATAERSAAALAAMTTLQARLLDLIAGIPTLRALAAPGPERRHRRTQCPPSAFAMATLRIAFLSALVLELLATLGVALSRSASDFAWCRRDEPDGRVDRPAVAPDVFWPLASHRRGIPCAQDGRNRCGQGVRAHRTPAAATVRAGKIGRARAQIHLENLSVTGRDGRSAARSHRGHRTRRGYRADRGRNGAGKSTTLQ